MTSLADSNILVRLANQGDPLETVASHAVSELHRRGETLCIAPQNIIEFWNVATRPISVNGLGLTRAQADYHVNIFESAFRLLPDTPDIYPEWKSIVSSLGILGKQVHDARLVAVCHVHKIDQILTFNTTHFARYSSLAPGLAVLDPAQV